MFFFTTNKPDKRYKIVTSEMNIYKIRVLQSSIEDEKMLAKGRYMLCLNEGRDVQVFLSICYFKAIRTQS